jgi:glutathione S-transferase
MKLYGAEASGNCYKIRLFASLHNIDYEDSVVDLQRQEHKSPAFLDVNPLGQIPILDDDGIIIRDSQAILIYLAGKISARDFWPDNTIDQAEITQWLSFAAREMFIGCAIARAILKFKRPLDLDAAQKLAITSLEHLEGHLSENDWLALGRPTIADIAVYPYAALVWEGDVSLTLYPNLRNWFDRVETLPGYQPMSGLPAP